MQVRSANSLWSPYGAFEMKAKYQRNYFLGTLAVVGFVALILLVALVIANLPGDDVTGAPSVVIKTIADLGPPPSVAKKPPQVQVNQPQVAAPKVGIPKPVADDDVIDEDVVLATREELADIVAPDISSSEGAGDIVVDISDDEYLPAPDEFVAVEVYPEMIHQHKPPYPRLAENAGIEGTVWIKALVDKDGSVRKAMVARSSGTTSLDESAVEAAYKNKYRPGIQNGRPIAVWVTYKFEWQLD